MKRSPLKRYMPLRAKRSKPHNGKTIVRLRGLDLVELRRACYMRDCGLCQDCGKALYYETVWKGHPDRYHMAHRRNKRMYGDTLDNVRALCGDCHRAEHGNPLPKGSRSVGYHEKARKQG